LPRLRRERGVSGCWLGCCCGDFIIQVSSLSELKDLSLWL
jgi:hypothetical protein